MVRWLEPEEIPAIANPVLEFHGWAPLNAATARVLGAFDGDQLQMLFVIQLYPVLGPLVRVDNTLRDDGATARELTAEMHRFLQEADARGALCFADSPITERLAKRFGLKLFTKPVYHYEREPEP